jgi:hypothetical protein
MITKARKYQTKSKSRNQNLNKMWYPERKQSQRCQTVRHQLPKAKESLNSLYCIYTQEQETTETLSKLMQGFELSPNTSTAIVLRKLTQRSFSTIVTDSQRRVQSR